MHENMVGLWGGIKPHRSPNKVVRPRWVSIVNDFFIKMIVKSSANQHSKFDLLSVKKQGVSTQSDTLWSPKWPTDIELKFSKRIAANSGGFGHLSFIHIKFSLIFHDSKGQIILKGLFGVLEFSQKKNKQIRRSSKNKFVRSGEFEDTNYLLYQMGCKYRNPFGQHTLRNNRSNHLGLLLHHRLAHSRGSH